jgi:hypothetical protein
MWQALRASMVRPSPRRAPTTRRGGRPTASASMGRAAGRCILLVASLPWLVATPAPALAQAAPFCPPGQVAQFGPAFAELKLRLGARMGDPVECQHPDPDGGGTLQHTTSGLAYDRSGANQPSFTNGWEHYALVGNDVMLWRNEAIDPPVMTPEETAYLQATFGLRSRVDQIDQELTSIEQQGRAGALDNVDLSELGPLVDELTNLRSQFADTPTPSTLTPYAQLWIQVQDADIAAAAALVEARLTQDPAERTTNLDAAATQLQVRDQSREAGTFAISQVLPVVFTP